MITFVSFQYIQVSINQEVPAISGTFAAGPSTQLAQSAAGIAAEPRFAQQGLGL